MPSLALVVPSLGEGGGVRSVAQFIFDVALRDGRWDVHPVSLCMSSSDAESVSLRSPTTWLRGVQVGQREWLGSQVPHVGAYLGEMEFRRYRPRRALQELLLGCDVVQVVCGSPAWANAVLGAGKPVSLQVATLARVERRMRDSQGGGAAGVWRRWMTRVTDRLDARALVQVDAIQLENPWMLKHAQALNARRPGVDIRYAPPGVDTDVFHPAADRNPSSGYVLCVGRLDDPRKNIGLLLEAYASMDASLRARHALVLAGSGRPPEIFWQRVEVLGLRDRILFIDQPSHEELIALYQQAGVFALPSDEEGFGMVVVEAMACGVPAICTRSGGPDGIIHDEIDGFLVPLHDARAMGNALTKALEDPAINANMGRMARDTAVRSFGAGMAGDAFVDVWNKLLARQSMRPAQAPDGVA